MDMKISHFDPSRMNWTRYSQQLEFFLSAQKVEETLKKDTVLTVIGDYTFNLLCDIIAPATLQSKSLSEIMTVLGQQFCPKPLARCERYKLRKRLQLDQESVMEYSNELRKIAVNCDLNDKLNFILSDQFIFGLKDTAIQKRLMIEKDDITFDQLIQLAAIAEANNNNAMHLQNEKIIIKDASAIKKSFTKKILPSKDAYSSKQSCKHCGANHNQNTCKYKNATCNYCKKKGHIKPICRLINKKKINNEKHAQSLSLDVSEEKEKNDYIINSYSTVNQIGNIEPIVANLTVDGKVVAFEVDSGAAISILPSRMFNTLWPNRKLQPTSVILRGAFDHIIKPLGICKVNVKFNNYEAKNLELFITKKGLNALLGRSWFHPLGFSKNIFSNINQVKNEHNKLKILLDSYRELFSKELGLIKGVEAELFIKKDAVPKFFKHRAAPFAIIPAIEEELDKLERQGVITPTRFSKWSSPIVPILKKNGTLRICGDYKVGLNPNLIIDHYPLPIIEDILSKLAGGKYFSKLDLTQAYQQVCIKEESREFLTINTHKGLYKVNRLPFGITSAPAIFQKIMDTILSGIDNVICYLDDILIISPDIDSHYEDLNKVFKTLSESGIKLNLDKCEFLKERVEYLGHTIDAEGIHPSLSKINALSSAPAPTNVDQLRSFLGLIGYYRKFIPDLATKLTKLNNLLCKNSPWIWDDDCKKEFELVKKTITSNNVLTHYNPKFPLIVASDASPWGLGAVLSHKFPNGSEKPIIFASRSLTATERNYSQLDREALGIVFAIKKFHKYIFGRKFTLLTDHKPLTRIFSSNKEIPPLAASRLQHWSLILAGYTYNICYRPSKEHLNADALSRLPIKNENPFPDETNNIFNINYIEDFPWTTTQIAFETQKDAELSVILNYLRNGWPQEKTHKKVLPEFNLKKEQLSIQDNCIMWGLRVIIPQVLRPQILRELHRCHTGIVKMKLLAHSLCWWPKIDSDIEQITRKCRSCQLQQRDPPKTVTHPWIRPEGPWMRIHTDLMGPFLDKNFLVTVDAFSKWPEIKILNKTDSNSVMETLEEYFIRYGFPEHIISDNGTQFTSAEFNNFCKNRGIKHSKSPPYHPATNGQAERFVEIAKDFLKKMQDNNSPKVPIQSQINEFLFTYRSTPHATLKLTPSEMFLGRKLRTRLSRINPLPIIPQISFKKKFIVGQQVLTKTFGRNEKYKWGEGSIKRILGPVTFLITLPDGRDVKRHMDQIRPSSLVPPPNYPQDDDWELLPKSPICPTNVEPTETQQRPEPLDQSNQNTTQAPLRQSTRIRRPPDRLTLK